MSTDSSHKIFKLKILLFLRNLIITILLCLWLISCGTGGGSSDQDQDNATPEDFTALALSPSVVTLSWNGLSASSSIIYKVYRDNQLIGSTSETQFIDAELTPNSTHDYYIVAIEADQSVDGVSHAAKVTTLPLQTTSNRFFPDTRLGGSTTFKIQPIESVNVDETVRISFGIPFPKGFLSNIDAFRILDETGKEMQIFAKALLPWRDLGSLTDLPSIRSVLVQMDVFFSSDSAGKLNPLNFSLEWGQSRSLPMLSETNVRKDWVLVDDHKYPASYLIYEPKAYAIFTPEWYGENVIKTRVLPLFSHQEFSAHDHAFILFGDTAINHVDPRVLDENLQPYLNSYANWLFDRASTLYQLAFRSGEFRFLREAHRAAQFYASHINDEGYFSLKPSNDLKYSYGESILTNYLLIGDEQYMPKVQNMISAWDSFETFYTLQSTFWTERHAATQLMGYVTAYELFGDPAIGQKAKNVFSDLRRMQLFPDEGMPLTGGLMHLSLAHGEGGNNFITSPWMSTLLLDAVERYYIHSSDSEVAAFVIIMANFLKQMDVALWE